MNNLSLREREIIHHLAEGRTHEQIALMCAMSKKNVERYLASLRMRFKCTNCAHLIDFCYKSGILKIMAENPIQEH